MRLKRIIISMILILSITAAAFMFTGCTDPITDSAEAYNLLNEANKKMEQVTGYTVTCVGIFRYTDEDGKMATDTLVGNMKYKNGEFVMESTFNEAGVKTEVMYMYYKDGYYYFNENNEDKYKVAFDISDALAESDISDLNLSDLVEQFVAEGWEFKGSVEGGKNVFTFTFSLEGDKLAFDMKTVLRLNKDGALSSASISADYGDGETMKINYRYDFKTPTLTFPTDLDTYEEWVIIYN